MTGDCLTLMFLIKNSDPVAVTKVGAGDKFAVAGILFLNF